MFVISIIALALSMVAVFRGGSYRDVEAQTATSVARTPAAALQDDFTRIAEMVEPAVVSIEANVRPTAATRAVPEQPDGMFELPSPFDFFRRGPQTPTPTPAPSTSTGSGVIVRLQGDTAYVLTNYHVVDGAETVKVIMPGEEGDRVTAKVIGTDDRTDLAVLSMKRPAKFTAGDVPKFGDSGKLRVGQWAIAIGNPLGVGQTLTVGVISALDREVTGVEGFKDYRNMIQTDASINPGNSGGPLVNINGEVVGINTAIASPSRGSIGIGFAIPASVAKSILDQLITEGAVTRGYLGVATSNRNRKLSPELKEYYGAPKGGALVETVNPDTPAAKAGLKPEDVIVAWDGNPITSFDDLEKEVQVTPPGRNVRLDVVRNRENVTVTVTTAKRPSEATLSGGDEPAPAPDKDVERKMSRLGISVSSLTPATAKQLGVDDGMKGVVITQVEPGGPAGEAGIPRGSVILRVGRTSTPTVKAFQDALAKISETEPVILLLNVPQATTGGKRTNTVVTIKPAE